MSKHEFKVGDRVRVTAACGYVKEGRLREGDPGTVTEILSHRIAWPVRVKFDRHPEDYGWPCGLYEIELIEPAPSKRKWAHSRKEIMALIDERVAGHVDEIVTGYIFEEGWTEDTNVDHARGQIAALKDILVLLAEEAE